jgi:hypothetical protein
MVRKGSAGTAVQRCTKCFSGAANEAESSRRCCLKRANWTSFDYSLQTNHVGKKYSLPLRTGIDRHAGLYDKRRGIMRSNDIFILSQRSLLKAELAGY